MPNSAADYTDGCKKIAKQIGGAGTVGATSTTGLSVEEHLALLERQAGLHPGGSDPNARAARYAKLLQLWGLPPAT